MIKTSGLVALLLLAGLSASACGDRQERAEATPVVVEKPFGAGGRVEMELDGGDYEIRPAADARIRVTLSRNVGQAKADVTIDGTAGRISVLDTPDGNFRAVIEVPSVTDLVVRLKGGNLLVAGVTGHKTVDSTAGNTEIHVGDPNDYARVDASVKAGNIETDAFGRSTSGLFPHLSWTGPGKYVLQATLGAGNLELRR